MLIKVLVSIALSLALTGCSILENKSDPFTYPEKSSATSEKSSATLLADGCSGLFETGNQSNRADNISMIRELVKIDPSYLELLRSAIELDQILGTRSVEDLKTLTPVYKEKVFSSLVTIRTYCG